MKRTLMKSKIHGAIVTDANLEYEGSISICPNIMEEVDIIPNEQVHIWNVTNGKRIISYAIRGTHVGQMCINGAGAHLFSRKDKIIIATFAQYDREECIEHKPKVIIPDHKGYINNYGL